MEEGASAFAEASNHSVAALAAEMIDPAVAGTGEEENVVPVLGDLRLEITVDNAVQPSRMPVNVQEYVALLNAMFTDWAPRLQRDPAWLMSADGMSKPQEGEDPQVARLRGMYTYLTMTHSAMMTAACTRIAQPAAVKPGGEFANRLREAPGVRRMALGCGRSYAFCLMALPEQPTTHYMGVALLSDERVVTARSLINEMGAAEVDQAVVDVYRTQQYHVDETFQLLRAEVLNAIVCADIVLLLTTDAPAQEKGRLSLVRYMPLTHGSTALKLNLEGTEYGRHRNTMIATNGMAAVLAVPTQEGSDPSPDALLVYNFNHPEQQPYVHKLAKDGGVITALAFDSSDPTALAVAYADHRMLIYQVPLVMPPAAADEPSPGLVWARTCAASFAPENTLERATAVTPEQELKWTMLQDQLQNPTTATDGSPLGKKPPNRTQIVPLREPVRSVVLEPSNAGGRLALLTDHNMFLWTDAARPAPGQPAPPTLAEHLVATGDRSIHTLPFFHVPIFDGNRPVSVATAGNYAVAHMVGYNRVWLYNLCTGKETMCESGSDIMRKVGNRPPPEPAPEDESPQEQHARLLRYDLQYQAQRFYPSCWATLGRAVVQLPDATLLILDGVGQLPHLHKRMPTAVAAEQDL